MTPEKRNKIKALMNNSESTENEKQVCKNIIAKFTGVVANHSFISSLRRAIHLKHVCEQCGNRFQDDENDNALYCDLCLSALKRKAASNE